MFFLRWICCSISSCDVLSSIDQVNTTVIYTIISGYILYEGPGISLKWSYISVNEPLSTDYCTIYAIIWSKGYYFTADIVWKWMKQDELRWICCLWVKRMCEKVLYFGRSSYIYVKNNLMCVISGPGWDNITYLCYRPTSKWMNNMLLLHHNLAHPK